MLDRLERLAVLRADGSGDGQDREPCSRPSLLHCPALAVMKD